MVPNNEFIPGTEWRRCDEERAEALLALYKETLPPEERKINNEQRLKQFIASALFEERMEALP